MEVYSKVKDPKSKEMFLRAAYVALYASEKTKEDVDTVEFSEVEEETVYFAKQRISYDIEYQAEIGYNRIEQYVDQESYYDAELGKHRTRPVVKNRTVVDWQPYSNKESGVIGDAYMATGTSEKGDVTTSGGVGVLCPDEIFNHVIRFAKEASEDEFSPLTEAHKAHMSNECYSQAEEIVVRTLPGDTHRNFRGKGTANSVDTTRLAVDRDRVSCKIDGEPACTMDRFVTVPDVDIFGLTEKEDAFADHNAAQAEMELESNAEYQKNKQLNGITLFGGGAIFLLAFMLDLILGLGMFGYVLMAIGIASVVVSQVVFGKKMNAIKQSIKEKYMNLQSNHLDELQDKKEKLLEKRFATMGWDPLTEFEKEQFVLSDSVKEKYFEKHTTNLGYDKRISLKNKS